MAKQTQTATAAQHVAGTEDESKLQSMAANMERQAEALLAALTGAGDRVKNSFTPNMKRMAILIAKVVGYACGTVAMMYAISYLSSLMIVANWPIFLIAVFEISSFILGLLASWYASDKIVDWIVDGGVARTIGGSASWIKSKFNAGTSAIGRRLHAV